MKNTSRDHFSVLCCHRASFGRPFSIPAAVGCPDVGASFLQRSTWAEFRVVLAGLRDQCPTAMPVVVRTACPIAGRAEIGDHPREHGLSRRLRDRHTGNEDHRAG